MSMFSVETPTVSSAAGQVQEAHGRIDGLLTSLNSRLSAVLDNPQAWRGDSQVAFAQVHEKVDTAMRHINEALSDIGTMLTTSASTYTGSDADNRVVITSVAH
jgi:WXG100 family type VII secretion target